jgi:beta-N-acetylhexosaminidase
MEFTDIDRLSLEQKVGQLFFIGIPGPELDVATRELLDAIKPGGVCLFARNIKTAEQTRYLLDAIREHSSVPPVLSLDQEGGLVDRLRRVVEPMPAADRFRSRGDAYRFGTIVGETISTLGFNMDFAPVVDIVDKARAAFLNGLQSRAYGTSKEDTIELAGAFLKGLHDRGILGCLKHFPGLGASEVDSHEELPRISITREELFDVDLAPYRHFFAERMADSVMIAHAAYPQIDLQETDQDGRLLPSSLSFNFVTKLLREQLGYDGVAITDDLEMGAIVKNYGIGEACKMAVLAGEDMLTICAAPDSIYEGFEAVLRAMNSGGLNEDRIDESLRRIARLKSRIGLPPDLETSRLEALSADIAKLKTTLA